MFNSPSRASTPRRSHAPRHSSIRAGTPGSSSQRPDLGFRPASPALSSTSLASAATTSKRRSFVGGRPSSLVPRSRSEYGDASDFAADDADMTAGGGGGGDGGIVAPATLPAGHVLKRDDFNAVTVFSTLPRDVAAALEASDPYIDAATGHLDEQTGYGVLVNSKTCYVWSFANRKAVFSTCYTFPSSNSSSTTAVHALPHVTLVPRSSGREPGLLIASIDGQVRFFDSVAASLTGQDRSQVLNVALGAKETLVGLARSDPSNYVVSTSQSRLFRITVASSGGRLVAQLNPFTQSRGIFGRLFGGGAGPSVPGFTSEGIVSVVACPAGPNQGSKDVFAVGQRTLQKWRLADGGPERLLSEQDIGRSIANSVAGSRDEVANLADSIGLEIIDAAARADGSVFILYSYVKQANRPLAFGVAVVALPSDTGSFILQANDILEHTALRDPRPYSSPHLVAPNGGPAVFVVFADSLILTIGADQDVERFEEKIVLKDGARNRFLGFGSEGADVEASNSSIAVLSCLSAQSGALLVEFSIEAARSFTQRLSQPAHRQAALNERLQNQLEQAVFFDQSSGNPLSFAIASQGPLQGDLEAVAERISSEIVSSTSRYLGTHVDVREHLADRLARLVTLIEVVNENHLLNLLSHRSRSSLCADAELLSAGADLWRYHNQQMSQAPFGSTSSGASLLVDAIEDVMAGLDQGIGQDTVRLFFRSQLSGIIAVFENWQVRLKASLAERSDIRSIQIAELDRIALTAFTGALRYKQASARQYSLEKRTTSEAWTCRPISLQLLESLFTATEQLIHDRTRELGDQVDIENAQTGASDAHVLEFNLQKELKTNLCELARCTLTVYEERISYLSSVSGSSDGPAERERSAVESKYQSLRPRLLKPLVGIGRADRAFPLAEQHGDFRTLTELCVDPSTGNPDMQIQHYMRRYGRPFAFEVFQYYVETEQFKELLSPRLEWNALLEEFLKSTGNTRFSWLHDLKLRKYHAASETLLTKATLERADLKSKNVLLSLGKLSYLAELTEEQMGSSAEQRRIESIDDQLDVLRLHEKLKEVFGEVIESQGARVESSDVARQADIIVEALLSSHVEDEAYTTHYRSLTRTLLFGRVLTSEDLIDLFTLKAIPTPDSVYDFTLALQICLRATDLQESRLQAALGFIWRRAILADDWTLLSETQNASDDEMNSRVASSVWYQTLLRAYTGAGNEDDRQALSGLVLDMVDICSPPPRIVLQARLEASSSSVAEDEQEEQSLASRLELLYADVESEVERVSELVDDTTQTGQWIHEAKRRAQAAANADAML